MEVFSNRYNQYLEQGFNIIPAPLFVFLTADRAVDIDKTAIILSLSMSSLITELTNATLRSPFQINYHKVINDKKIIFRYIQLQFIYSSIISFIICSPIISLFYDHGSESRYIFISLLIFLMSMGQSIRSYLVQIKNYFECIIYSATIIITFLLLTMENVNMILSILISIGAGIFILIVLLLYNKKIIIRLINISDSTKDMVKCFKIGRQETLGIPCNWVAGNAHIFIAQYFLSPTDIAWMRSAQTFTGLSNIFSFLTENAIQIRVIKACRKSSLWGRKLYTLFTKRIFFSRLINFSAISLPLLIIPMFSNNPHWTYSLFTILIIGNTVCISLYHTISFSRAFYSETILRNGLIIGAPISVLLSYILINYYGVLGCAGAFSIAKISQVAYINRKLYTDEKCVKSIIV